MFSMIMGKFALTHGMFVYQLLDIYSRKFDYYARCTHLMFGLACTVELRPNSGGGRRITRSSSPWLLRMMA
jgi:hypothetical protein